MALLLAENADQVKALMKAQLASKMIKKEIASPHNVNSAQRVPTPNIQRMPPREQSPAARVPTVSASPSSSSQASSMASEVSESGEEIDDDVGEDDEDEDEESTSVIDKSVIPTLRKEMIQRIAGLEKQVGKTKGQKGRKGFVNQIFGKVADIAANLLPVMAIVHAYYGKEGARTFEDSKERLHEVLAHSLEEFFIGSPLENDLDLLYTVMESIGLEYDEDGSVHGQIVDCYLKLVSYGLHSFWQDLPEMQKGTIASLIDEDADEKTQPVTTFVNYIIDQDVQVVCHEIKCHNCQQVIYGFRYNCDQMAMMNYCWQCVIVHRCARSHKASSRTSAEVVNFPTDGGNQGNIPEVSENNHATSGFNSSYEENWEDASADDISYEDEKDVLTFSGIEELIPKDLEPQLTSKEIYISPRSMIAGEQIEGADESDTILDSGQVVQNIVEKVVEEINNFIEDVETASKQTGVGNATLADRWRNNWRLQLEKLQTRANLPHVCIAVASPSGAGKSSLLNAIIGERILPSGCTSEACSSGAVEICYWPKKYYEVEVDFMNEYEWLTEKKGLLSESSDNGLLSVGPHKTLKSIYGPDLPRESTGKKFKSVTEKFPCYVESNIGKTKKFQVTTADAVRRLLCHFTTETKAPICLWPIVKKVIVRGPFIELGSGARLVDLPGMNDICEARVQLMNKYLTECHYIWVLSNIGRCATDAGSRALINENFLMKLTNNKMWASLCYIATKSDELTEREIIDKLNLPKDTDTLTCAIERNKHAKKCIEENLIAEVEEKIQELCDEEADFSFSDHDRASLERIKVFTVSAKNYLQLIGEDQSSSSIPLYTNINQTEVPLLQTFLLDATKNRAQTLRKISDDVGELLESIVQELSISVHKTASKQIQRAFSKIFKEFQANTGVTQDFTRRVTEVLDDTVSKKLTKITQEYRNDTTVNEITDPWKKSEMHFQTLKATCARQGLFRHLNFNYDIGKRLLTGLMPQWDTFFHHIEAEILNLETTYTTTVKDFHQRLGQVLNAVGIRACENMFKAKFLEETLQEKVNLARGQMTSNQKQCCDVVEQQIRKSMIGTYEISRATTGKGAKLRMVENLVQGIKEKRGMFEKTRDNILEHMKNVARNISGLLQEVNSAIQDDLQRYYQIYWDDMAEKGPFEMLIRDIRDRQKQRDFQLDEALKYEEQQREKANERRLEFQRQFEAKRSHGALAKQKRTQKKTKEVTDDDGSSDFDIIIDSPATRKSSRIAKKPIGNKRKTSDSAPQTNIAYFFAEEAPVQKRGRPSKADKEKAGKIEQISRWTQQQVSDWIKTTSAAEHSDKFLQNKIKGGTLLAITDKDLRDMEIRALGDRREIMQLVTALKQ